jgi:hypothetical protein
MADSNLLDRYVGIGLVADALVHVICVALFPIPLYVAVTDNVRELLNEKLLNLFCYDAVV